MFKLDLFNVESAIEIKNILMITGIIWIIISIFLLNFMSLNEIRNDNKKISKSIIYGNLTLTILFAGFVLIIASIGSYKDFIINLIKSVMRFIFSDSQDTTEIIQETEKPSGDGGFDFSELAEAGTTSPFRSEERRVGKEC